MIYQVDENRTDEKYLMTGIYVRAINPFGKWGSVDIAQLDKQSLHAFLRQQGGKNLWAESVVGILLGHGNFEEDDKNE